MGTQPRPTQMTLLSSVHNLTLVLVPLTHCSKDGHKKASSPWAEACTHWCPHCLRVHSTSLVTWFFGKIIRIWFTRCIIVAVLWLWTVTNQMNISDYCCLILDLVECDKNVTTVAIVVDWFSSVPPSSSSLDRFLSVVPRHKEMVWYNAILWTVLFQKQRNLTKG